MDRKAVAAAACGLVVVLAVLLWPKHALDASVYLLPGKVRAAYAPANRSLWIGEHFIADLLPRWNPEREFLFFSHIPRTSGGTFSTLLNAIFPPRFTHPASSYARSITGGWRNFLNASAAEWVRWKVLYTHEDFSLVRYIPREVAMLVWLRNPAKQRRSLYDVPVQKKFQRGHPTIRDWIGTEDYPIDYQIEWVAGVLSFWPYSKAPESFVNALRSDRRLLLRRAVRNLAATTWFGITERQNESLCLFFYTHQLRPRAIHQDYRLIHKLKDAKRSEDFEEIQRPLLALEYEFLEVADALLNKRLEWMRKDYELNARPMRKYVAPECAGVLPALDFGSDDEADANPDSDAQAATHAERGDPAKWRRRRTQAP